MRILLTIFIFGCLALNSQTIVKWDPDNGSTSNYIDVFYGYPSEVSKALKKNKDNALESNLNEIGIIGLGYERAYHKKHFFGIECSADRVSQTFQKDIYSTANGQTYVAGLKVYHYNTININSILTYKYVIYKGDYLQYRLFGGLGYLYSQTKSNDVGIASNYLIPNYKPNNFIYRLGIEAALKLGDDAYVFGNLSLGSAGLARIGLQIKL